MNIWRGDPVPLVVAEYRHAASITADQDRGSGKRGQVRLTCFAQAEVADLSGRPFPVSEPIACQLTILYLMVPSVTVGSTRPEIPSWARPGVNTPRARPELPGQVRSPQMRVGMLRGVMQGQQTTTGCPGSPGGRSPGR
jgi:hypothetical protein